MADLSLTLEPESPADAPAVERLHERAFGPGRFARTAFRLREGAAPMLDLSFTARVGTLMVGSIRLSALRIGAAPALLLGPITIDPAFQGRGVGAALMRRAIEAARARGHGLIVLIGDEPYYRRFGFTVAPPGRLVLPGPVDPNRLLWLALRPGAEADAIGAVAPSG